MEFKIFVYGKEAGSIDIEPFKEFVDKIPNIVGAKLMQIYNENHKDIEVRFMYENDLYILKDSD